MLNVITSDVVRFCLICKFKCLSVIGGPRRRTTLIGCLNGDRWAITNTHKRFWSKLDGMVESVPRVERVAIGADFSGRVAETEVMGRSIEEYIEIMLMSHPVRLAKEER